jgi:hypothetical protein
LIIVDFWVPPTKHTANAWDLVGGGTLNRWVWVAGAPEESVLRWHVQAPSEPQVYPVDVAKQAAVAKQMVERHSIA